MNTIKLIGAILIVCGIAGIAFGSISFTKETHKASLGPIALAVQEKETVNIPLWASIAAVAAGAAVLAASSRKG
jgi:hypothetical protein